MSQLSLSKQEMEDALKSAITQRKQTYTNHYALEFRIKNDDSHAEEDGTCFAELAKLLGFPAPEVHIFPWDIYPFTAICKLSEVCAGPGRSIVMIRYAGYVGSNADAQSIKRLSYARAITLREFLEPIISDSAVPFDAAVDIIIIFDCALEFVPARIPTPHARIVEILTSGQERDHNQQLLTSKLLVETRKRVQNGDKYLEIADLVGSLDIKTPGYVAKFGTGSITLPLSSAPTTPITRSNTHTPAGLLTMFSLRVSEILTHDQLKELANWIRTVPEAKGTIMKLENVKQANSNSMILVLEASRLSYLRICGLPGVDFICENQPAVFSWLLATESPSSPDDVWLHVAGI